MHACMDGESISPWRQEQEQEQLHPIACEACRAKKCKCDRELPACSQCMAVGGLCRYPRSHKRGIPTGYIACVEQRLLETEVVLFDLLSTVYDLHPSDGVGLDVREAFTELGNRQSKSAKVDEWRDFPLKTKEQRQYWWKQKTQLLTARASQSATRTVENRGDQTVSTSDMSQMGFETTALDNEDISSLDFGATANQPPVWGAVEGASRFGPVTPPTRHTIPPSTSYEMRHQKQSEDRQLVQNSHDSISSIREPQPPKASTSVEWQKYF